MVKLNLLEEFELKDLGKLEFCLWIQVIQDHVNIMINLNQVEYITRIFQHFKMEKLKPWKTPIDINVQFTKGKTFCSNEEIIEMEKIPYKAVIGCIMYSMIVIRADVAAIGETRN